MSEINYKQEVLKVYPDAIELDNETDQFYANLSWVSDGHGKDLSADCKWPCDPWEDAYNKIKK